VVVDDGSTDGGADIAASHRSAPLVIRQSQCGAAAARNRGALAAGTSHVAFLDQDDLWLAERHERLAAFLRDDPSPAVVTNEFLFVLEADLEALAAMAEPRHPSAARFATESDAVGEASRQLRPTRLIRRVTTPELLTNTIAHTTSFVFERELFFSCGGFPTFARSAGDYWLQLNVSRLTPLAYLDEPSVLHRLHPDAASASIDWSRLLLTSVAAARHGESLVPAGHARDAALAGDLEGFVGHWLGELASERGGFLDAIALAHLLTPESESQTRVRLRLAKRAVLGRLRRAARSSKPA
ncbi:MAG: hypothetical protein QOF21_2825, partial [Actinomycetota bacterium]